MLEATGQLQSAPIPFYPDEVGKAATERKPKTLRDVIPSWVARNGPKKASQDHTQRALDLLEQPVGLVPLPELTKAHGALLTKWFKAFREYLAVICPQCM